MRTINLIEALARFNHMNQQKQEPLISLTWGLDDTCLVGLGCVAVPLPVGQPLHHLAALCRSSLAARFFSPSLCLSLM